MKIDQNTIEEIKTKFAGLQDKSDLLNIINYAITLMYQKKAKPIKLQSLTYYANPKLSQNRFYTFSINKKSGGERIINAPALGLKTILTAINVILQVMHKPESSSTGFVQNKSIVDNAKVHLNSNYVYNIDLKDFFHSFDRNRVKLGFMNLPFGLKDEKEPLAFLISCLCTHPIKIDGEYKTVLPQGSPTSPTITNILCKTLDRRLRGVAKRFGAKYTRYADDITFSSQHNIYNNPEFNNELKRIIEDQGLKINTKKTRLQKAAYRQEVTGLTVNEIVNVKRRYIKTIRMWLYYWEKYGYAKAQSIFKRDYSADKGHVKKGDPNMANVIAGKLKFLKMVKSSNDSTYIKLKTRFDNLTNKLPLNVPLKDENLNSVLNKLVSEGLESAMQSYTQMKKQKL